MEHSGCWLPWVLHVWGSEIQKCQEILAGRVDSNMWLKIKMSWSNVHQRKY